MPTRLLFISDLHLQESRPDLLAALLEFLKRNAGRCAHLYILGDLFDVWLGDDDDSELIRSVAGALRAFRSAGSAVHLMHGNRDFLMGNEFAARCGAELIPDPLGIETSAGAVLLLHGDTLCTDDVEYQQFRRQVRHADWQRGFLARPLPERRAIAANLRERSRVATARKAEVIMDVNQQAVRELFRKHRKPLVIHGHTHRPAVHEVRLEQPVASHDHGARIVLGDWDRQLWFAEIDGSEVHLRHEVTGKA